MVSQPACLPGPTFPLAPPATIRTALLPDAVPAAGKGEPGSHLQPAVLLPKLYCHCCRLELYVAEPVWQAARRDERNLLFSAIQVGANTVHAVACTHGCIVLMKPGTVHQAG